MVLKHVRRLIVVGMHALRLNNPKTQLAIKQLVALGIVEAKNAGDLAKAVSMEAAKERKRLMSFLAKEAGKEWKWAKPHAVQAAKRSKRFVGRLVRVAKGRNVVNAGPLGKKKR